MINHPKTIGQVDDLVNNIIFGVILVVIVLMFFLGFKNAIFVGFAIPMSYVYVFDDFRSIRVHFKYYGAIWFNYGTWDVGR